MDLESVHNKFRHNWVTNRKDFKKFYKELIKLYNSGLHHYLYFISIASVMHHLLP